jgi:hypothetical protein
MDKNPILIIHGWSDDRFSFRELGFFIHKRLNRPLHYINVADWISLDDDVTIQDLAYGLEKEFRKLNLKTIDIISHSTGTLIVREWLTSFYSPDKNPVHRFISLAGAVFGSYLAHKGKTFLSKILKSEIGKFETGESLLQSLELSSPYLWNLAFKDIFSDNEWYGSDRILLTSLVGNTGYSGIASIINESGSDGIVRISDANFNSQYISLDLTKENPVLKNKNSIKTAFGILDGDNHSTIKYYKDKSSEYSKKNKIIEALTVNNDGYERFVAKLQILNEFIIKDDK